jgi:hypothetical protein
VIESPDVLTIGVEPGELARCPGLKQAQGEHLVRPDGTIGLGTYGSVRVTGRTPAQAQAAVERHLSRFVPDPKLSLAVTSSNSKVYYLILDGGSGEQVFRFPLTGRETVLDALGNLGGRPEATRVKQLWLSRPTQAEPPGFQLLSIDYRAMTQLGDSTTNCHLAPGDRVYINTKPPAASPPAPGSLFVVLRISDSGTKVEREESARTVALAAGTEEGPAWAGVVQARPGWIIADLRLGEVTGPPMKNVRATASQDAKSFKVTADRDQEPSAKHVPEAPGPVIQLTVVEERETPVKMPVQVVFGEVNGWGAWAAQGIKLPLPPRSKGLPGWQRRIDLEIRRAGEEGRSYLLLSAPDIRLPWQGQIGERFATAFGAEACEEGVHVTWTHLFP